MKNVSVTHRIAHPRARRVESVAFRPASARGPASVSRFANLSRILSAMVARRVVPSRHGGGIWANAILWVRLGAGRAGYGRSRVRRAHSRSRGTAPLPNATRPSQRYRGRRRRRTDDETKETRVFSPRVDVARDRRVPVRPPRSAYGVNQLVPSCRWGKTPREGHAAVEKTLDEAAEGGTYGGRTRWSDGDKDGQITNAKV